jgi:hypothetical protein
VSKPPNNPAGRLLKVVSDLKQIQGHIIADEAWASVLGIEVSDTGSLLKGIGATLQLGQDTIEAIKKQDLDHDLYIGHVNQILKAFQKMHLGARIIDTMSNIKQEDIVGLSFCDERLSRKAPEKTLNENDLKKIHEDIMSLIDEVTKGDIDEYLRQYLLDKLDLLRQAVAMYHISGIKPIENAIHNVLGSTAVDSKLKDKFRDSSLSQKVFRFVFGLYITIQCVNNIAQLPESIDKILPISKQVLSKIIQTKGVDSENVQDAEPSKDIETGKNNENK